MSGRSLDPSRFSSLGDEKARRIRRPPSAAPVPPPLLILLGLVALACRGDPPGSPGEQDTPSVASDAPAPASVVALNPTPGLSLNRALGAAGTLHRFTLDLEAGTAAAMVAEASPEARLEVRVRSPGLDPILTLGPAEGGFRAEELRLVAEVGGVYRIEVRASARPPPDASFSLHLRDLQPALPDDLKAAAVDRLLAEAEALRSLAQETADREAAEGAVRRAAALDREALELASGLGDRRRQAEALDHLGWIHRKYLGESEPAADFYQRAAQLFGELQKAGRQARVLNNLGRVLFDLGNMEGAVKAWSRSLPPAQRAGDGDALAASYNHLALHARYRGEIREALRYYDATIQALEPLGRREELGRAYNNRGRLYRVLAEGQLALADLGHALAIAEEIGSSGLSAIVLTALGRMHGEHGELEQARVVLERALALRRQEPARRGEGVTLRALGSVYERLGLPGEAREAYAEASTLFLQGKAPRDVATVLEAQGRLAFTEGKGEVGIPLYRKALGLFRELEDPYGEVRCLAGIAAALRAIGRGRDALGPIEEALDRVEEVRATATSPLLQASYFAGQQEPFDLYIDLLMELDRVEPGAGYGALALEASERSRSRMLMDLLAAASGEAKPELLEEKRLLEARLGLLERERLRLRNSVGRAAEITVVEEHLAEAVRRYRTVEGEIRGPNAGSSEARTLGLAEIRRRVLDPDTLLLEYRLGRQRSYLWALSTTSFSSHELPPGEEIERLARKAYTLLKDRNRPRTRSSVGTALEDLGKMLLGPVAGKLGKKRLLVSAEGALLYIPFAALTLPRAPGEEALPLLSRHEVVTLPSASALAALRAQRSGRPRPPGLVAVLADPVFEPADPRLAVAGASPGRPSAGGGRLGAWGRAGAPGLRRLTYTRHEAEAIQSLAGGASSYFALGFEANRQAALSPALGRYRILHLATHGILDSERPELSRLVLSRYDAQGRELDGTLHSYEVYGLYLPVDLVVLSACNTALGRELRGEGLVGLPQAFLQAGAAAVVVSLWPVNDRSTAELMKRFYRELLLEGRPPSTALRQAQLSLLGERRWRPPFYWAGFLLLGEWRGPEPAGG